MSSAILKSDDEESGGEGDPVNNDKIKSPILNPEDTKPEGGNEEVKKLDIIEPTFNEIANEGGNVAESRSGASEESYSRCCGA